MNTLRHATRRSRLARLLSNLSLILLFTTLIPGCAKDGLAVSPVTAAVPIANQTPMIIPPIHPVLPQEPFQAFVTTYNVPPTNTNVPISLQAEWYGEGIPYDNAEQGFSFRSSAAGNIIGLGIMMPVSGYSHTVLLWDSATQVILATAVVKGIDSAFTYTSLTTSVPIQANHAYVVGYSTLAIGNTPGQFSKGNEFYGIQGFLVDRGEGLSIPMLPFREGNITVEDAVSDNYGSGAVPANPFPIPACWAPPGQSRLILGICDIEFAIPI